MNKFLKICIGIGIIVISFSIFYHLVVSPEIKRKEKENRKPGKLVPIGNIYNK